MAHIISYEIVSSIKPASGLFTSASFPKSEYYKSLFNKYLLIEREKRLHVHNSIVYHSKIHNHPSIYWCRNDLLIIMNYLMKYYTLIKMLLWSQIY